MFLVLSISILVLSIVTFAMLVAVVKMRDSLQSLCSMSVPAVTAGLNPDLVCYHTWDRWSKPRLSYDRRGWGRVQRRNCTVCGEEEERWL